MAMIDLPPDFKEFLQLLNVKQVRYLVVGGYAVAYHGHPRATGDIDVWLDRTPSNLTRVVDAIRQFGFPEASIDHFSSDDAIVRMGIPPMRIELLVSVSGVDFAECYEHRVDADLGGVSIPFISLDHLRENKRAARRSKDLSDLDALGGS